MLELLVVVGEEVLEDVLELIVVDWEEVLELLVVLGEVVLELIVVD